MEELVFKYVELQPEIEHPTKLLSQRRHGAEILIRDGLNRWVLARKKVYPDGLFRLIGGGIEDGENPLQAAVRELREEVDAVIDEERLAPLIHAEIFHPSIQDQPVSVFVFYCPIARNLKTHDELEYLGYFTDHELNRVINQFNHLPTTIIPDDAPATWADYGKIWGPIHAAAFERVKELGL